MDLQNQVDLDATSTLEGAIDSVTGEAVTGWARDPGAMGTPMRLVISDNGRVLGEVVARQYRADLAQPGFSHGCHGFEFAVPGGLAPGVSHSIEAWRAADGVKLPGTPCAVAAVVAPTLLGQVDSVTRHQLRGWAQIAGQAAPVPLQVLDNGAVLARVMADQHRADLQANGIGTGLHGFELAIPGGLTPGIRHVIEVQHGCDGMPLAGSPMVIEAEGFDTGLERSIETAIATLQTGAERQRALSFMLAQTERLLQLSAAGDGPLTERQAWQDRRRRAKGRGREGGLRRALVISAGLPAEKDAEAMDLMFDIESLQQLGYEITLVAADDLAARSVALEKAKVRVCSAPLYVTVEEVLSRQANGFDVVYFPEEDVAARYLNLAKHHLPAARVVHSAGELRRRRRRVVAAESAATL